jgi:hypothetical protein
MAKVIVRIRNGIAQSVEGIPTDMFIEVRNYDVADMPEEFVVEGPGRPALPSEGVARSGVILVRFATYREFAMPLLRRYAGLSCCNLKTLTFPLGQGCVELRCGPERSRRVG